MLRGGQSATATGRKKKDKPSGAKKGKFKRLLEAVRLLVSSSSSSSSSSSPSSSSSSSSSSTSAKKKQIRVAKALLRKLNPKPEERDLRRLRRRLLGRLPTQRFQNNYYGSFRKLRDTLFWGPYNKDPTI